MKGKDVLIQHNSDADSDSVVDGESTSGVRRRTVLAAAASAAVGAAVVTTSGATTAAAAPAHTAFQHGVASGDPLPSAVLLWTRITTSPRATPGSGLGEAASLRWEIAQDKAFAHIVRSGSAHTSAAHDHTVTVDATGLEPATRYFYRFISESGATAGQMSPVGRTKTAPANGADPRELNFGFVSCVNYESGYFTALRRLAEHDSLDAVVALGDYIYEYAHAAYVGPLGPLRTALPTHTVVSLNDYRQRFGTHRTDRDLQEAHRKFPWICTLDDHEYADNAYADGEDGDDTHVPARDGTWADRKRAALKAYTEWMPVRWSGNPDTPRIYRNLRFGRLADLSMLDLRSYRTKQPSMLSSEIDSPAATITGKKQLDWLIKQLTSSKSTWQLIGNPVMISPLLFPTLDTKTSGALASMLGLPSAGLAWNTDQWDGYTHDRKTLFDALRRHNVPNPVFMTGDIHSSWANNLSTDVGTPSAPNVGVEFVVPSVSANSLAESVGVPDRTLAVPAEQAVRVSNPHVRWVQLDKHGFVILRVTKGAALANWYLVDDITVADSPARVAARWTAKNGSRRVTPA